MDRLRFGPAGVPIGCKKRDTVGGILCTAELGLDAMEMEFVRGVRMSKDMAVKAGKIAKERGIVLTAHAPYYINLLSTEEEKVEKSIERILNTARITNIAGGYSIVFHPAYYGNYTKEEAIILVKKRLETIVERAKEEKIKVWIRPETMGKISQFGSFEEILELSSEFDLVLPCIDFAHIYARTLGLANSPEKWRKMLERYEEVLGSAALKEMHIHISGMEFGPKGERRHLNLEESGLRWKELLEVLKEFDVAGVVISESPNIEADAILMKKFWESL